MRQLASVPIEYDRRHGQFTAQAAIRDPFDAVVELITNADDSYFALGRNDGTILVEVEERRGRPSRLIVRDRAQGLNDREMRDRLARAGGRMSAEGARGFMGRGAKDCAVLGRLEFESIKDGRLHKCAILPSMEYVPYGPSRRPTAADRERLQIPRGNGTLVTLTVDPASSTQSRIPRLTTLERELPWHYALREIMSAEGQGRVLLRNANQDGGRPTKLRWETPAGATLKTDESYEVPEYPGVRAHVKIWRVPDPLQDPNDRRFRRTGIWVRGQRAVHDCSLLAPELEQDVYAHRYFGSIACSHIDTLCDEYDACRRGRHRHPTTNPSLLIDPNRRDGLRRDHPFTRALLDFPLGRLRALIAEDKRQDEAQRAEVLNEQSKRRLQELARAAGEFLREETEDSSDRTLETTDSLNEALARRGVMLIPSCSTLVVGETQRFYFYARRIPGQASHSVRIEVDDESTVKPLSAGIILQESPRSTEMMYGSFYVKGITPTQAAAVRVSGDGFTAQEAVVDVVSAPPTPEIPNGFSFELEEYHVREAGTRTLTILAAYPGQVTEPTECRLSCSSDGVNIIGRAACLLTPVAGAEFAQGTVRVRGRRLRARAILTAELPGGVVAECLVRVVQRPETGPSIRIDVRNEDYGNFRAKWDQPDRPNLLLVSAKHESVKRYLGPAGDNGDFPGQNEPYFRLLLAEIVSENICRRRMIEAERARPWEFQDMDVDAFYAYHNRFMKDFTPRAHRIMLSDRELRALGLETA